MSAERNKTVDFLKGIAILFVIITHFNWSERERAVLLFPYWVDMAVPTFLFLSGYVNSLSRNKWVNINLKTHYSKQRISKNFVRYTTPFLLFYFVEQIIFTIKDFGFSPKERLFQIINGGIGQGSYFFPIIIQFVFIFPLIYELIKKKREKGVAYCLLINVLYEVLKTAYFMNEECYRLLVFRYIFVIAMGCYAALGEESTHKRTWAISMTSLGGVYIWLVMYTKYQPQIFTYWTGRTCFGSMFIIPFLILLVRRTSIKINVINFLGKASYNILFVQMLYYLTVDNLIYRYIRNRYCNLFAAIIICCILGTLFYKIEKPITDSIIKKYIKESTKNE